MNRESEPVGVFSVFGTSVERQLVFDAVARTRADWHEIFHPCLAAAGFRAIEVWWLDLSWLEAELAAGEAVGFELEVAHPHVGHALVDQRRPASPRVLAIAWSNARIDLDLSLLTAPDLAALVFVAELAVQLDHLCFTDDDRRLFYGALHGHVSPEDLDAADRPAPRLSPGRPEDRAGDSHRSELTSALMDAVVKAVSDVQTTPPWLFPHQASTQAVQAVRRTLGLPDVGGPDA